MAQERDDVGIMVLTHPMAIFAMYAAVDAELETLQELKAVVPVTLYTLNGKLRELTDDRSPSLGLTMLELPQLSRCLDEGVEAYDGIPEGYLRMAEQQAGKPAGAANDARYWLVYAKGLIDGIKEDLAANGMVF